MLSGVTVKFGGTKEVTWAREYLDVASNLVMLLCFTANIAIPKNRA